MYLESAMTNYTAEYLNPACQWSLKYKTLQSDVLFIVILDGINGAPRTYILIDHKTQEQN